MIRGGGQVPRVGRRPERSKSRVDLATRGRFEGMGDPVAYPLQHRHIAGHPGQILGGCINTELLRPEVKANRVDLRGGPVTKLKVEDRLRDVDRLLDSVPGLL